MKPMQKESIINETHDVDLLNEGLQGEYFAITAYDAALGTGLLSARATTVVKGFQADHRAHAQAITEAIERLGGRASAATNPAATHTCRVIGPPHVRMRARVIVGPYGPGVGQRIATCGGGDAAAGCDERRSVARAMAPSSTPIGGSTKANMKKSSGSVSMETLQR